jgi:hypothetical protein
MPTELLLVVIAKALTELAALFLLGRGLLYVLAGRRRAENIFYQLFSILTNPVLRAVRWVTPRVIMDSHIPVVAVVLLLWIWIVLVILKARFAAGG